MEVAEVMAALRLSAYFQRAAIVCNLAEQVFVQLPDFRSGRRWHYRLDFVLERNNVAARGNPLIVIWLLVGPQQELEFWLI